MTASNTKPVAILGGTFDPVHHGHLRLAIDIAETLKLHELRLMPGYQPVHRDRPSASVEQRLQMLKLAVANSDVLTVDDRELLRKGPSWTLLSLKEIRNEIAESTPLYFILGEDAFCHFDSWYHWEDLINYAHLLVAVRPGSHPKTSKKLQQFVQQYQYQGEGFPESASGNIIFLDNPMLDIASSDIRERISNNRNIQHLLPTDVIEYLQTQKIY
ncbi:MAG: nicotinate-nucleotide adenylyltransferase [Gammaproteobacteria bacterium]|nr:nicotinate-nucleotide adenylyltransferase [Gammaproteobacteria bacterium]